MAGTVKRSITQALYLTERGWQYLFGWRQYGIGRHDLVLDVGSGGHPFIRADILCDRFLLDNAERQSQEPVLIDRPFVVADASRLPFRDQAFDFSHSSHLLEHLDDPQQHLRELQRVSRRGVIITPYEAWERIYPIDAHRWVVNCPDATLMLTEKSARAYDPVIGEVFHHSLEAYGLQYFLSYFRHVFEVRYRWDSRIQFTIAPLAPGTAPIKAAAGFHEAPGLDSGDGYGPRTATKRFKSVASRVARRLCSTHGRVDVWSLLVCPGCHGELCRDGRDIRCESCGRRYELFRNEVPILLVA